MKVFMIGGTGLLGSEGARVLIEQGHEVSSIALPPIPKGAVLPEEMKLTFGNHLEMTDDEIREQMKGCEGFVFAAGVDERVALDLCLILGVAQALRVGKVFHQLACYGQFRLRLLA